MTIGNYGNVYDAKVIPTSYFNTTTTGTRIILTMMTKTAGIVNTAEIYKNGNNAVYVTFSVASTIHRVIIYGVK